MDALIGKKLGMTQVYDDKGCRVPVTVIEAGPCVVLQRKTDDRDGYSSVQLGFSDQKEHRVTKASLSRFKKVGTTPKKFLKEFRVGNDDGVKAGDTVTVAIFDGISHVDVTGVTKGRGFAGVVRRHGMRGGPMTHGGHSKRRVGSIGQNAFPARVRRGQRMPGHMGVENVTQQHLKIIGLRGEDNILLVRGAIPGAAGSVVYIRKALKLK